MLHCPSPFLPATVDVGAVMCVRVHLATSGMSEHMYEHSLEHAQHMNMRREQWDHNVHTYLTYW